MTASTKPAVTLYTKATCPFCIMATRLLTNENISFVDHNYSALTNDELIALQQKTNRFRTVPQIFVGETFIGGFDQLNKLFKNGELATMLNNL